VHIFWIFISTSAHSLNFYSNKCTCSEFLFEQVHILWSFIPTSAVLWSFIPTSTVLWSFIPTSAVLWSFVFSVQEYQPFTFGLKIYKGSLVFFLFCYFDNKTAICFVGVQDDKPSANIF
jgi:hypothetical protein